MDNELLTIFVGIIAICMVFIAVTVVVVGSRVFKTMKRVHEFIDSVQQELSFLSTKVALTLHDISEFIFYLKTQTSSLGAKSFLALHELHEMISYIHTQTRSLVYKAANGITKVTLGSLAIDALFKLFQKNKTK